MSSSPDTEFCLCIPIYGKDKDHWGAIAEPNKAPKHSLIIARLGSCSSDVVVKICNRIREKPPDCDRILITVDDSGTVIVEPEAFLEWATSFHTDLDAEVDGEEHWSPEIPDGAEFKGRNFSASDMWLVDSGTQRVVRKFSVRKYSEPKRDEIPPDIAAALEHYYPKRPRVSPYGAFAMHSREGTCTVCGVQGPLAPPCRCMEHRNDMCQHCQVEAHKS